MNSESGSAAGERGLAEAERRIEEARRTQAETLDLSDLALSQLPASLVDLEHVGTLYLGKYGPTGEGWLREPPELTGLAPLAGLSSLRTLNLAGCKAVTDLSPLAELQELQAINLSDTGVSDLSPLARLQRLQSLDLSSTRVSDVSPL